MISPARVERIIEAATDRLYAETLPQIEAHGPLSDDARREWRAKLRKQVFEPMALEIHLKHTTAATTAVH